MYNFKKEQLEFLDVFNIASDTTLKSTDKLRIKTEGNSLIFSLTSSTMTVVSKIDISLKDEIDLILPIGQFTQLIKFSPEGKEIIIEKEGIKFSDDSKYKFNQEDDIQLMEVSTLLENKDQDCKEIELVDLMKTIILSKNFIGSSQDGFDAILLTNTYFIASNKSDFIGAVKSNNKSDIFFYLPKILILILNKYSIDIINIKEYENWLYINIMDIEFFLPKKQYILPNIFEEGVFEKISHNTFCKFNKKEFLERLKRISVTTQNNLFNRTFLTFTNKEIIIENKDLVSALEKINHNEIDSSLDQLMIAVSSSYIQSILNSLSGETIKLFASNDDESSTIKIMDENEDNFFIHILYELTEF